MKTYTSAELTAILEQHKLWLSGKDGSRAYLRGANLSGAELYGTYLSHADLRGANLSGANLSHADLRGANLSGANLSHANLSGAELSRANLSGAYLRGANLSGAELYGANLSGAELSRAKNIPLMPWSIIAAEGTLTVYKKTKEGVVTLQIPENAKRSNATTRKCRASEAIVIAMPSGVSVAHSKHDPSFTYSLGQTIKPINGWDENRWNECAPGIHFFLTREEAEAYEII